MTEFADALRSRPTKGYKVALVLDEICEERGEFSSSEEKLYNLFFELEKELPDLFSDFVFEERNVHPFSQEVHNALFDLENAGILAEPNPGYLTYVWRADREKIKESILKRFDQETIFRIRRAVSKIAPSWQLC
jgi:hypothetical protein